MGWYVEYPETVNLNRVNELKNDYKEDRRKRGLEKFSEDLVGFTSSWIYDTWENSLYIATLPKSQINDNRVRFFEEKITTGSRPFVILIQAFYQPEQNYSGEFILDGHHKLQAYKNLNIDPPCVTITRNFHTVEEPEFDIESLARYLYPWQIQHIIDN